MTSECKDRKLLAMESANFRIELWKPVCDSGRRPAEVRLSHLTSPYPPVEWSHDPKANWAMHEWEASRPDPSGAGQVDNPIPQARIFWALLCCCQNDHELAGEALRLVESFSEAALPVIMQNFC